MSAAILLTFLVSLAQACSSDHSIWPKDKRSDTPLFRFVVNRHIGYIDTSGKIVIEPQFIASGNYGSDDFFEGVATLFAFPPFMIDRSGRVISFPGISPTGWSHFSEGLMRVFVPKTQLYGFIDHEGVLRIPARYQVAAEFSSGLAAVELEGRYGYIDHSGDVVIKPRYLRAEAFSEDVARVIASGPCLYTGCEVFRSGEVLGLPGPQARPDKRQYPPCRYTFVDKVGKPLFDRTYPDAFDFSEGLAAVAENQLWGFVDKSGTERIPLQFSAVRSFTEGLAAVRRDGKWGYIDRGGHVAIPFAYDWAEDFSDGFAVVWLQKQATGPGWRKAMFIDRSGRQAFGRDFDAASGFRLGLAHVRNDGPDCAFINREGHVVFTYRERGVPGR